MPSGTEAPRVRSWIPTTKTVVRLLERAFAVFGMVVAICWLTIDLSVIVSPSMAPTLQGTNSDDGDRVLTEKISRWFRSPRRWEVITFRGDNGDKRMKRVVGLPGEGVQMTRSGELLIDGKPAPVPDWLDRKYFRFGNLLDATPVLCGEGYYVLGDDLKDSDDSRFNGPVPPHRIIGRAWLIVWPRDRFGFVR